MSDHDQVQITLSRADWEIRFYAIGDTEREVLESVLEDVRMAICHEPEMQA